MKLIHLSDLHLGRRLNEFSLLEEQRDILNKIIDIIDAEKPDCVVIAGDVYNKSVPSAEAVQLFDDFLSSLSERKQQVFVVSGNHDSAERIAFGARLMTASGIHMSQVYNGAVTPTVLKDDFGNVNIYMLPFIKPAHVKRFFSDRDISGYTDALRTAVEELHINTQERNILVTHQLITGALRCDSEEISIGGTDNIDADVFNDFDYVALGHIHSSQNVGRGNIRYCGSPLKYSLSEVGHEKSVTVAELGEKGKLDIRTIPLVPMRDVKEYKGTFEQLTDKEFYGSINTDDYVFITLTDEMDIPDAVRKLRKIYPHMAKMRYDNSRTRTRTVISYENSNDALPPDELFVRFYEHQNNHSMTGEQLDFIRTLISSVWEEELK